MRLLALLVLAGVLAAPATAAVPEGFRESARLSPIISRVAGVQATVYCASSPATWRDHIAEVYPAALPRWSSIVALTVRGEDFTRFATWECQALEGWLRGKPVTAAVLGRAILTLTHEAQHLAGITDEGAAECAGLRLVRSTALRSFRVKKQLAAVVAAARREHALKPASYRSVC